MRIYLLLAMAASASFIGANCGDTGVGDPCTPEDEYLTGFSGFSQSEVNVESRSFQCETRVCLVNHFQGRVSCPYGQIEDPAAAESGMSRCMGTIDNRNSLDCQPGGAVHRDSCQVPDRDGSRWEDRIIPPVEPQLKDRQAVDAVYCSCRCAPPEGSTEDGAEFCECPSGFVCEPLVEDLGLGRTSLAGSYCVKEGTQYDPGAPETVTCDSTRSNCAPDFEITVNGAGVGTNQQKGCLPPGATCGDGDSCCRVSDANCNDTEGDSARNCFGTCNGNSCQHLDQNGNPVAGALETLYTVKREECNEGDTC